MILCVLSNVEYIFDLCFTLEIQWFDKNLVFEFLKNQDYNNFLFETTEEKIWTPKLEFGDIKKVVSENRDEVVVLKRGKPALDADLDFIRANEVYAGSENPLKIIIERRIQFSCSFDNIKNFPFGKQKCFVKFCVVGAANYMTTIRLGDVRNDEVTVVGQYVVDQWITSKDFNHQTGRNTVRVTMILSREIVSTFW